MKEKIIGILILLVTFSGGIITGVYGCRSATTNQTGQSALSKLTDHDAPASAVFAECARLNSQDKGGQNALACVKIIDYYINNQIWINCAKLPTGSAEQIEAVRGSLIAAKIISASDINKVLDILRQRENCILHFRTKPASL